MKPEHVAIERDEREQDAAARLERDKREFPIRHYKPRAAAVKFHMSDAPIRFCFGGNRSGKTYASAYEVACAMTGMESRFLPGSGKKFPKPPTHGRWYFVDMERSAIEVGLKTLLRLMPPSMIDRSRGRDGLHQASKKFHATTGSTCQFMSYEMDANKLASVSLDLGALDKGPKEDIYEEQKVRILDKGGRMWGSMTVDERHSPWPLRWIDRRIVRKGDGDMVDWFILSTEENIKALAEEKGGVAGQRILSQYESIKKSMSDDAYRIRILGQFGWASGMVYPDFDREKNVWGGISPSVVRDLVRAKAGAVFCGLDHGRNHPTACLWAFVSNATLPDLKLVPGDYFIFHEYRSPGPVPNHVEAITAANRTLGVNPCYYFADQQLWWPNDQGGPCNAQLYFNAGCILVKAIRAKEQGWASVEELIRVNPATGWPRLRIHPACRLVVEEMEAYEFNPKWAEGTANDRDITVGEDLASALRYLCVSTPDKLTATAIVQAVPQWPVSGQSFSGLLIIPAPQELQYACGW